MKILKCNNDIHFENFETYSEEESIIGAWIDGKPIYRKVLTSSFNCTSNNPQRVAHGIDNLDLVLFHREILDSALQLPYINGAAFMAVQRINNTEVQFECAETGLLEKNVVIILEYTKTTD